MPDELRLGAAFAAALAFTALTTPLAMRLAVATGFFDHPHSEREGYKRHRRATPYLGGLALAAGLVAGGFAFGGVARHATLWACALGMLVLGTIDDRVTVRPRVRVLAEVAAGSALWAADAGWSLGAGGAVDLLATQAWVVVVVNAFNLMDNQDGAAASVGLASALGIAGVAVGRGDPLLAALALAIAGACAGFLPFNLSAPSARIFLGDGGSMTLGFLAAAAAMAVASEPALGWTGLLTGALLVALPLLDTSLVVVSRLRRGISPMTGGRDHITHRLAARLGSARRVALLLGVAQAALGAFAAVEFSASATLAALTACGLLVSGGLAVAFFDRPTWIAYLRSG